MADRSKIEWTDASWNPVRARNRHTGQIGWFCKHVSEACRNCYAEGFNLRLGTRLPYHPGNFADIEIFLDEKLLLQPLRWKRPRKIFVASMTDIAADFVTDEMLDKIFAVAALCPQHTFQFLTKRPARMRKYMQTPDRKRTIAAQTMWVSQALAQSAGSWKARIKLDHFSACFAGAGPFRNVWLGVTCEDQATADERIPDLLATTAAVHFISAEPLLGPIDLHEIIPDPLSWNVSHGFKGLDWVICGGESGPNARPMHPDWARTLLYQCAAAGVPFFFKQWGEWAPDAMCGEHVKFSERNPGPELHGFAYDEAADCWRVGKRRAGRLLDGIEHNAFPEVAY